MELEPARTPTGSAHSRAGPRHYLIAGHAHWLVPPEAGPLRRSALTLPAPWAQPRPCHLSPWPHAAFGVHGPQRQGKVLGRAGLRPEGSVIRAQVSQPRWGPILLLLGCVTLGNRPYLPEPPPLVFSAVKKKMSDVTPALPNPFPSTCQVPGTRGVRVPHCLLTARGAVMIMGFQKRKPAQSPEGPPKVTQQESHRAGI